MTSVFGGTTAGWDWIGTSPQGGKWRVSQIMDHIFNIGYRVYGKYALTDTCWLYEAMSMVILVSVLSVLINIIELKFYNLMLKNSRAADASHQTQMGKCTTPYKHNTIVKWLQDIGPAPRATRFAFSEIVSPCFTNIVANVRTPQSFVSGGAPGWVL